MSSCMACRRERSARRPVGNEQRRRNWLRFAQTRRADRGGLTFTACISAGQEWAALAKLGSFGADGRPKGAAGSKWQVASGGSGARSVKRAPYGVTTNLHATVPGVPAQEPFCQTNPISRQRAGAARGAVAIWAAFAGPTSVCRPRPTDRGANSLASTGGGSDTGARRSTGSERS